MRKRGTNPSEKQHKNLRSQLLVTALDTRLAIVLIHFVVAVLVWSPSVVGLGQNDLLDNGVLIELLHRFPRRQGSLEVGNELGVDVVRELDGNLDVEVSRFVVTDGRHALAVDDLEITILDDLAWYKGNDQNTLVEVLDCKLATTKRRQQVNLDFRDEVVVLSLEAFVRLLFDDNDHVSRLRPWHLIALSAEGHGLAVLHALVDVNFQDLLLGHDLLALTLRTPVLHVDDFASPRTLVTRRLHLLDHGTHLAESNLDTTSMAGITRLDSTVLASLALALAANNVARKSELGGLALVEILEGDMDTMDEILGSAGSLLPASTSAAEEPSSSSTEELTEQILGIHATTTESTLL